MIHSNPLLLTEKGGRYDIDTTGGQSGSPVYFMEYIDNEESCCVVGIHKGYDKPLNKNVCTLISEEIISDLDEWVVEMGLTFRVGSTAERKQRIAGL